MSPNTRIFAATAASLAAIAAIGFYLRGPAPEDVLQEPVPPTPAIAATEETQKPPLGGGKNEGFTFAYVGGGEEDDFESGCAAERICLMGHFAPELPVKILLPNGDSCTGGTGDAYNVESENGEADFTALAVLEGCLPSDVGNDGTVALVALPDLMDANFKWLPTIETEGPKVGALDDKGVQAVLSKFAAYLAAAKQKPKLSRMTVGKLELLIARGDASESSPKNGPVFALTNGKPVHLGGAEDVCQTVTGAFALGATPYVIAESGPCAGDARSNVIYEWTGKGMNIVASEGLHFP